MDLEKGGGEAGRQPKSGLLPLSSRRTAAHFEKRTLAKHCRNASTLHTRPPITVLPLIAVGLQPTVT